MEFCLGKARWEIIIIFLMFFFFKTCTLRRDFFSFFKYGNLNSKTPKLWSLTGFDLAGIPEGIWMNFIYSGVKRLGSGDDWLQYRGRQADPEQPQLSEPSVFHSQMHRSDSKLSMIMIMELHQSKLVNAFLDCICIFHQKHVCFDFYMQTLECELTNCLLFVNLIAFLSEFLRLLWCDLIHKWFFSNREMSLLSAPFGPSVGILTFSHDLSATVPE